MTETIEQKALALVNEVRAEWGGNWAPRTKPFSHEAFKALCRAIEQHEAFRQEVSEAAERLLKIVARQRPWLESDADQFASFIIPQPDPLVEVMNAWWDADGYASIETFRAALAARGLKIVEDK